MMDWVIEKLRYKARLFKDIGAVTVYTRHVVKSDSVIPESLKLELQAAVAELEDVPDKHKDWHPESNGRVLDLVHPSLYPLVYGRTRVLETGRTSIEDCIARCGEGQATRIPSQEEVTEFNISGWYYATLIPYSRVFQWLFLAWLIFLASIASMNAMRTLSPSFKNSNVFHLQDHKLHQQPSPTQVQRSLLSTH